MLKIKFNGHPLLSLLDVFDKVNLGIYQSTYTTIDLVKYITKILVKIMTIDDDLKNINLYRYVYNTHQ